MVNGNFVKLSVQIGVNNDSKPNLNDFFDICVKGKNFNLLKQAAKVSRVDRDIPKSSSSHPQVILKSSTSHPQVIWSNLFQSANLIQSDPI